jgi:coenzyme F420 hydrogenase subunit beta
LTTLPSTKFDELVNSVVANGNCSGCGACALIDSGLSMELDETGFNRPRRLIPLAVKRDAQASREFSASCPGLVVRRPDAEAGATYASDPALGRAVSSWQAWAVDADTRFRGSSGGVLTAISGWLVESGQASTVVGAAGDAAQPRRTVSIELGKRADFKQQSGSRYAPVSMAAHESALGSGSVVVGKPCEASALRQLMSSRGRVDSPILLSFFCAGVPSQQATERLLTELGIPQAAPLRTLRYRGHGWPGNFYAESIEGAKASTSYDESWGKQLGPSMQWRCKVCPDGVGESADIVAGDYWKTDAKGYPVFTDSSGVSALIARTKRGHEIIMAAIQNGVIEAEPLELSHISNIQPYQVERRATLWARLLGRRLAGWKVPSYSGFGLFGQSLQDPVRALRYVYGSFRRSRPQSPRD